MLRRALTQRAATVQHVASSLMALVLLAVLTALSAPSAEAKPAAKPAKPAPKPVVAPAPKPAAPTPAKPVPKKAAARKPPTPPTPNPNLDCSKQHADVESSESAKRLRALADCLERSGAYVAAFSNYSHAVTSAKHEKNKKELASAALGVKRTEKIIGHVEIVLDDELRQLDPEVVMDGKPLLLSPPTPADPGQHVVHVHAIGRLPWETTLNVRNGLSMRLVIPQLELEPPPAVAAPPEVAAPPKDAPVVVDKPPRDATPSPTHFTIGIEQYVSLMQTGAVPGQYYMTFLRVGYSPWPRGDVFVRLGAAFANPPGSPATPLYSNPMLGVQHDIPLPFAKRMSIAPGLFAAIPIGPGGGNSPDKTTATALALVRDFEGTPFDVNYFTLIPTARFRWRAGAFDLWIREEIRYLIRTRGEEVARDATRLRLHNRFRPGVWVTPWLELLVEAEYVRFLIEPYAVARRNPPPDPSVIDFFYAHAGAAATFGQWFVSAEYIRGLDAPLSRSNYHVADMNFGVSF